MQRYGRNGSVVLKRKEKSGAFHSANIEINFHYFYMGEVLKVLSIIYIHSNALRINLL